MDRDNSIPFASLPFVLVEFERLAWIPLHHGNIGISLSVVLFDGLVRMPRIFTGKYGGDRRCVACVDRDARSSAVGSSGG
jgi:hypothetical protein